MILDRAYELFAAFGYHKTTVADIADACGFSTANVHKHFGTKSAIKQAIARVMLEEMLAEAEAATARADTAAEKLRALITTLNASTLERFRRQAKVYETLAAAAEEKWEAVREYRLRLRDMVREIVASGVETGEFRVDDIDQAAQAIHMASTRVIHPSNVVEMINEPDAGDVDTLVGFLLKGLGADEPRAL